MSKIAEATRCLICGSEDAQAYAPGPNSVFLCDECARREPMEGAQPVVTHCSFCQSEFSSTAGGVRRRDLRVGLVSERGAICRSCLDFAEQVLAKQ